MPVGVNRAVVKGTPMSNPVEGLISGFQDLVAQMPDAVQSLIVAAAGAIPFIEEGAAGIGVVAGLNPVVAFGASVVGNLASVVLVVLLGARVRGSIVSRRSQRITVASTASTAAAVGETTDRGLDTDHPEVKAGGESMGKQKLRRWLVRFGVPGASLLAPMALPTQLTAAFLVSVGVNKGRVIVWQAIAIILWTALVTISATLALLVVTNVG